MRCTSSVRVFQIWVPIQYGLLRYFDEHFVGKLKIFFSAALVGLAAILILAAFFYSGNTLASQVVIFFFVPYFVNYLHDVIYFQIIYPPVYILNLV